MPRTRAQRRHALATALDEDTLSYILSFLPKLGVVPGRLYTLAGGARAKTGKHELSLKAILAPRRRRLIKCPADIPLLENAVAAAREGDVVLLTESVELQAPIVAPPFRVTIAAVTKRRYGNGLRSGIRELRPGQEYPELDHMNARQGKRPVVYVNTNAFPGEESGGQKHGSIIVASGAAAHLELRGIACKAWRRRITDMPGAPALATGVDVSGGARVEIENCLLSCRGLIESVALKASGGAQISAFDLTLNRTQYGILAEGAGTSVVVDNSLFNGDYAWAAAARAGALVDVRRCHIDACRMSALLAEGDGAHVRFDLGTTYWSRPSPAAMVPGGIWWAPRFIVRLGGRITFPAGAEDEYFHNKAHVLAKDGVELFEGPVEHAGGRPEPTLTLWYDVAGMTFQSRVPIGHNERESGIEFMGSNSYVLA